MPEKSDEEIANDVQNGDAEAFTVLVERYEEKMKRYARRFLFGYHDAEDQVQEVFLKAYENMQSFDLKRKFSSWLYRIAHNQFINTIKKKKKEPLPFFDADTLFPHPVAEESADDRILMGEIEDQVEDALQKLGPKYREPLVLYYFEELSYGEISEVLQIPTSTVGVRIKRAKDILKKDKEAI